MHNILKLLCIFDFFRFFLHNFSAFILKSDKSEYQSNLVRVRKLFQTLSTKTSNQHIACINFYKYSTMIFCLLEYIFKFFVKKFILIIFMVQIFIWDSWITTYIEIKYII